MPRKDPFKNVNWDTAPALHELSNAVHEHFLDARVGHPLAVNELVDDCVRTFKELGIVPQLIRETINRLYGDDVVT